MKNTARVLNVFEIFSWGIQILMFWKNPINPSIWHWKWLALYTTQKMKFSSKDFSSKCDQIHRKLRIWSHLLEKSLMENFIFCAVLFRKYILKIPVFFRFFPFKSFEILFKVYHFLEIEKTSWIMYLVKNICVWVWYIFAMTAPMSPNCSFYDMDSGCLY